MQRANNRFEGANVVITGTARGIGQACAREFVAEGATVFGGDQRDQEETVALCEQARGTFIPRDVDVTDEDEIDGLVTVAEDEGGVDVLVNNAGIAKTKTLDTMENADWDSVLAINLTGPFNVVRRALDSLRETEGTVVNIGSIFAQIGGHNRTGYCSSKAGVHGLTRALATELGTDNVRVNAVDPGFIRTSMTEPYMDDEALIETFEERTALKRLGKPEEVAKAVLFLASDEASFITGESILVDGGRATTEPLD